MEQRPHPSAVDAEQMLLGGLMLSPSSIPSVTEILKEEHFYRPEHRKLYRLLLEMHGRGESIDFLITVPDRVMREGKQQEYGGVAYVVELPDKVPSTTNRWLEVKLSGPVRKNLPSGSKTSSHCFNALRIACVSSFLPSPTAANDELVTSQTLRGRCASTPLLLIASWPGGSEGADSRSDSVSGDASSSLFSCSTRCSRPPARRPRAVESSLSAWSSSVAGTCCTAADVSFLKYDWSHSVRLELTTPAADIPQS